MRRLLILPLIAVVGACGGASTSSSTANNLDSAQAPTLKLQQIDASFDSPIAGVAFPNKDLPDSAGPQQESLLIAERAGRVILVSLDPEGGLSSTEEILDIEDQVGSTEAELGLLGIAVRPDGSELFVSYTSSTDGSSQLDSYQLSGSKVVRGTQKNILSVPQPYGNHNGGHIAFGPDGFLYMALGDGGSSGDPEGNAQNRAVLLGMVLWLDPDAAVSVAAGNPFVGVSGAKPQIWLTGVRNPWRFSFDSVTGDLWIGDVGQDQTEEINLLTAGDGGGIGANLGWDIFEGDSKFSDSDPSSGQSSAGPFTQPVMTYSHEDGCSVTGGVVYRGEKIAALRGAYLYGDFCNPELQSIRVSSNQNAGQKFIQTGLGLQLQGTVSFFEDSSGEVYVLAMDTGVFKLVSNSS
ncbi:MAG: PQQ-dependent sugar dehydrogenase [Microthrixaceae bacterium]